MNYIGFFKKLSVWLGKDFGNHWVTPFLLLRSSWDSARAHRRESKLSVTPGPGATSLPSMMLGLKKPSSLCQLSTYCASNMAPLSAFQASFYQKQNCLLEWKDSRERATRASGLPCHSGPINIPCEVHGSPSWCLIPVTGHPWCIRQPIPLSLSCLAQTWHLVGIQWWWQLNSSFLWSKSEKLSPFLWNTSSKTWKSLSNITLALSSLLTGPPMASGWLTTFLPLLHAHDTPGGQNGAQALSATEEGAEQVLPIHNINVQTNTTWPL